MNPVGLAPEWRRWVVMGIRGGADREALVAQLVLAGSGEALARQEVASIADTLAVVAEEAVLERRLALAARLGEDPPDLPTFPSLDEETFLREAWRPGRPAFYPGLVAESEAVRTWSFPALAARFGEVAVTFCSGREADPWCDLHYAEHLETASFADFVRRVQAAGTTNDLYLLSRNRTARETALGALLDELAPLPAVLDPTRLRSAGSLWIGPAGTHVRLHHDWNHGLFFQLHGRKRFKLHSPRLPALLAGMKGTFTTWDPDRDGPQPGYEVELGPGDALFLPAGWWHEVRALEPSISVTASAFRWPNDFRWYTPGAIGGR